MNIKYRQLKAFVLAVELESFSKAAAALFVTQPSFSSLIKELELDIGTPLFHRTTRRISLTDTGHEFHQHIQGSLAHIEQAYKNAKGVARGERGWLRVASLASLSLGAVGHAIGLYRQRFESVHITLTETNNKNVYLAVHQGNAELGVGTAVKADNDVCFIPIYEDRLHVIVPQGHALANHRSYIDWRTLESYPYILLRAGTANTDIGFRDLYVNPVLQVDHVASALAMVRNGIGVTALLSRVLPELNMKGLLALPMSGEHCARTIGAFYRRSHPLSIAACNFIDTLKELA